jgi:hypothetical protein
MAKFASAECARAESLMTLAGFSAVFADGIFSADLYPLLNGKRPNFVACKTFGVAMSKQKKSRTPFRKCGKLDRDSVSSAAPLSARPISHPRHPCKKKPRPRFQDRGIAFTRAMQRKVGVLVQDRPSFKLFFGLLDGDDVFLPLGEEAVRRWVRDRDGEGGGGRRSLAPCFVFVVCADGRESGYFIAGGVVEAFAYEVCGDLFHEADESRE